MNPVQRTFRLYKDAYSGLAPSSWWLSVVLLINRSGAMVIPFMTVYLTQYMHFDITHAGLVMACFGAGAIVGAMLGGWLSDKIGFYQVQFWSLIMNGVLLMSLGQMRTLTQICINIFILSSVGDAFRPANSIAIATYSAPENRTRSYALNRLAANLGWSVGPAIGGVLASFSYHLLFWVDGFSCIAAAILMRIFLPPIPAPPRKKTEEKQLSRDHVWKDHIYIWFIALCILSGVCLFQFTNIVPLYFKEVMHMEEWKIGFTLGLNGVLIVVVEMILVYRLEGRKSNLLFIFRGVVMVCLAYLALLVLPSVWAVAIFFMLIITFGEIFCLPFMNSFWVGRSKDHNRGQYAALYTISFSLANIISPTAGAFVVGHLGFNMWWAITVGGCIISAAGFLWLNKMLEKEKKISGML